MNEDIKYVVMKEDLIDNEIIGESHFIKYVDDSRRKISIYCPLIAPRYLYEYLKDNNYRICYEVKTIDNFKKYKDMIYVLDRENEFYNIYTLDEYIMSKYDKEVEDAFEAKLIKTRKKGHK